MLLVEEKSISNDVKEITDYIINALLKDCFQVKSNINENNIAYKENTIPIIFPKEQKIEDITLHYVIYEVPKELTSKVMHKYIETANCEYDNADRNMMIVGFNENGYLNDDFYGDVLHEVTHMFQYDQGMEKRVDLYDSVINMFNSRNKTEAEHWVSSSLYFTFAHEQDAFAHQFYGELKEMPRNISYNEALERFEPYKNFKAILNVIKQSHMDASYQKAIEKLGFTNRTFMQRIKFGFQRLKRKLSNAYAMHKQELTESYKKGMDISVAQMLKNIDFNKYKSLKRESYKEINSILLSYNDVVNMITESVKRYLLIKD